MSNVEKHLDIYTDRYEFYLGNDKMVFQQGAQDNETQRRYNEIKKVLADGYLEKKIQSLPSVIFDGLDNKFKDLLKNMVDGVTSEVGRALVGLIFLQLTIKSISPEQNIRLHKGSNSRGKFSWVKGISMRSIDSRFNTPFLRKFGLLKLNKDGLFMTRSLAENYPYTSLYKAEMRGPFDDWITLVDAIEGNIFSADLALSYLLSLLKNRSDDFKEKADSLCKIVSNYEGCNFDKVQNIVTSFFNSTDYSARAFEVSMHCFIQAVQEVKPDEDLELVALSQMRSANKKHGNVGDIELLDHSVIVEAWDAKYGKPYLRDELEELRDKLLSHTDVKIVGFVVDSNIDLRKDILARKDEIELETNTKIHLLNFRDWVELKNAELSSEQKEQLGYVWLKALAESFAQKRQHIAPIDEPCDSWVKDLIALLQNQK